MSDFFIKTKICTTSNSLETVCKGLRRILIVTDNFIVTSGKISYVTDVLNKLGIENAVYSEVLPDPDISTVVAGVEVFKNIKPGGIIAIGGGSPIDAAKAIMFFAHKAYGDSNCIFIAIPTTSGTGSEVTRFSVISDKEKAIKYPLVDVSLLPDYAILDPELVRSVPSAVTADTGMDVLTHAIEAYVSKNNTDFSDALAEKAIKLIFENLEFVCKNPNDMQARKKVHNASCLAGMAFDNVSLGVNHGLAHIVGARFKISHGRSNSMLMTTVIRFNSGILTGEISAVAERYAEIAGFLGIGATSKRQGVLNLIRAIDKLNNKVGIPSSFKEYGIDENDWNSQIKQMAEIAVEDGCTATNPVDVNVEGASLMLRYAFENK